MNNLKVKGTHDRALKHQIFNLKEHRNEPN